MSRFEKSNDLHLKNIDAQLAENTTQINSIPGQVNARTIARVLNKLRNKQNIKITGIGDSIMAGAYSGGTWSTNQTYLGLLQNYLQTTFGVTVTLNNRAISGHRAHDPYCEPANLTMVNTYADKSDLYIVSYGHNDIGSDIGAEPIGYAKTHSIAALEHFIRKIYKTVPNADIILVTETPYPTNSSSNNPYLSAYNQELKKLTAYYDVLFVDVFSAMSALGNWDSYINSPTTDSHPNIQGHQFMFNCIQPYFNAANTEQILESKRNINSNCYGSPTSWDVREWVEVTKDAPNDKYYLSGSGWTQNGIYWQTSHVGDYLMACFYGTECRLALDIGTNTSFEITVDNVVMSGLNNYVASSGNYQRYLIPFNYAGIHYVKIYLRSGSINIDHIHVLKSPDNVLLNTDNTNITWTGSWIQGNGSNTRYSGTSYKTTSTVGDSISFSFLGTGIAVSLTSYDSNTTFTVSIDGGTPVSFNPQQDQSYLYATALLASGLDYGLHTCTLTITKITSGQSVQVEGFSILDERRLEEPRTQRGYAKVGTNVTFPVPYNVPPVVKCFGNGVYPTNITKTGFTISGTSGAFCTWESIGGLTVY